MYGWRCVHVCMYPCECCACVSVVHVYGGVYIWRSECMKRCMSGVWSVFVQECMYGSVHVWKSVCMEE